MEKLKKITAVCALGLLILFGATSVFADDAVREMANETSAREMANETYLSSLQTIISLFI